LIIQNGTGLFGKGRQLPRLAEPPLNSEKKPSNVRRPGKEIPEAYCIGLVHVETADFESEEEAIEAWNKRVS